jgi:hypothetical protein
MPALHASIDRSWQSLVWQIDAIDPSRDVGALFARARDDLGTDSGAPVALSATLLAGIATAAHYQFNPTLAQTLARSALRDAVRSRCRPAMFVALDRLAIGNLVLGLADTEKFIERAWSMCPGGDEIHLRNRFLRAMGILTCLQNDLNGALVVLDEEVAWRRQLVRRVSRLRRAQTGEKRPRPGERDRGTRQVDDQQDAVAAREQRPDRDCRRSHRRRRPLPDGTAAQDRQRRVPRPCSARYP